MCKTGSLRGFESKVGVSGQGGGSGGIRVGAERQVRKLLKESCLLR